MRAVDWRRVGSGLGLAAAAMLVGCGGSSPGDGDAGDAGDPGETPAEADRASGTSATAAAPVAEPFFEDVAADVGLHFHHDSGTTGAYLFPEILGSGVALLDHDGDGDLDVYLVQGQRLDPDASPGDQLFPPPPDQPPGNRLFRNELIPSGELRFTDVTDTAGVGLRAQGMGVATGDYDNDGDPDLYVTNLGPNVLFRNEGDGTFTDVTAASGTTVPTWSCSASWFDADDDGDLDLFVVDYVAWSLAIERICTSASGNRDYCGPQNYASIQDHLFRNEGDGTFTDVSVASGIAAGRGAGLGVTAADFNGDGRTDVFVANDGEANHVWINRGDGTFEESGLMSGASLNGFGTAEASMGVTAGDYDGDGDEDLFMTHLINETNTLYQNDGSGLFTDVTARSGLGAASRTMTGFGSAFFDYDNDGRLDVYVVNGNVKVDEFREEAGIYPFDQRNQLFRNLGGGRFAEVIAEGGAATTGRRISRGAAFGDLDNDGDMDIVVTNNSGPVELLRNRRGDERSWIRLELEGTESGRDALGARIALERSGRPTIWRRIHTDGSYLSTRDPRKTIGLDDDAPIEAVGVIWPSGRRERWTGLEPRRGHRLIEGNGELWED